MTRIQKNPAANGVSPTTRVSAQSSGLADLCAYRRAGIPWPREYDKPGPRGRAEATEHLIAAGYCPGYTLDEMREAWAEAGELEREAIAIAAKRVAA